VSFETHLEKAWLKLEEGDAAGAQRLGRTLAGEAPDSAEVLLLLAACDRESGNFVEALALLERAAQADPAWATPVLWAGELLASDPRRLSEALERATMALDRAEEADELLDAITLKAGLEVDLGKIAAARKTLADLPPAGKAPIPAALALELAHLFLAVDDPAEAGRRFQKLADAPGDDPQDEATIGADAWYGLGLAAEAQDDEEGKRRAWLRTLELDGSVPLEDPLLDEAETAQVAEAALGELPERAQALIRNVPIVVVDLPARPDVERGLDPRLLGLFEGTPYPEASNMGGSPHLTQILLFRKNLERVAHDVEELRAEVRTTLLHETGHFFGMSEDDLAEVGLD